MLSALHDDHAALNAKPSDRCCESRTDTLHRGGSSTKCLQCSRTWASSGWKDPGCRDRLVRGECDPRKVNAYASRPEWTAINDYTFVTCPLEAHCTLCLRGSEEHSLHPLCDRRAAPEGRQATDVARQLA
jgi:hypothetical protein